MPERALLTAKSQSRNDLGEIPAGSLQSEPHPLWKSSEKCTANAAFRVCRPEPALGNPEITPTGRAIIEFEALFTTQIPAPLFLESSFSTPRRSYLNIGCGTNCGAVSISPLNISAGL